MINNDLEFLKLLELGAVNEEIVAHDFQKFLNINLNNTKSKISQQLLVGENELGYEIKLDNRFTQLYKTKDVYGVSHTPTWRLSIELGRLFSNNISYIPTLNNNFDMSGIYKPEHPKYYVQGSLNLYYVFDTQHLIYLDKLLSLMDAVCVSYDKQVLKKSISLVGNTYIKKLYIPKAVAERFYVYKFSVLEKDEKTLSNNPDIIGGIFNHKRLRHLHMDENREVELSFNAFILDMYGEEGYKTFNDLRYKLTVRHLNKIKSTKFINQL